MFLPALSLVIALHFPMQAAEVQNGVQAVRKRKRSEASGVRKKGDGKRQHVEKGLYSPRHSIFPSGSGCCHSFLLQNERVL